MPKETSIAVSKATVKLLKSYQKEFGFSSLEESIQNSVRWARLWNYVDVKTRRSMQKRISDLEFAVSALESQKSN